MKPLLLLASLLLASCSPSPAPAELSAPAEQDVQGAPSFEEAITRGHEAAKRVRALLGVVPAVARKERSGEAVTSSGASGPLPA